MGCVLALLVLILGCVGGSLAVRHFLTREGFIGGLSRAEEQRARADAERIIHALASYHGAHDAYPSHLDGLVPEFLDAVPVLPGRQPEWTFASENESYYLKYWVGPSYESDSYTPEHGWYMDR